MAKQCNPRSLAVDILVAVDKDGEFSHLVLRDALGRHSNLSRRDRAFVTRLCEGTIERMIELDYILDLFSNTEVKKMKPVIRAILRSGVYQLRYMDAVPDSAAVSEAVRLTSQRGFCGLSGFVNGVLRNIARNPERISYPSMEEDPLRALSVRYSMPEWITELFLSGYGQERCERILAACLADRPLCVRVDTRKHTPDEVKDSLEAQGIRVRVDPRLSYAFHLENCGALEELPEFKEGILYAQDVSSMMVGEIAQPRQGDCVLDVCASPGGKSIHVAQMMNGTGEVIARDKTESRVELIRENIRRCRVSNVRAEVWDALVFDPAVTDADLVLADVPCSGLGVIGHKTDIKYRSSTDRVRELAQLQRQILAAASRCVRPGGVFVYSTCTVTEEENQQNAQWFLEQFSDFSLDEERQFLPDEDCDGFYIARFIKG